MTQKRLSSSTPAAVVLSGNLGPPKTSRSANQIALAITRSLGRHGVGVYRFHPDRSLCDLDSRYCTHVPCPNLYDDPGRTLRALIDFAKNQPAKPVLFAGSDGTVSFISRNSNELEKFFEISGPSAECVRTIQDKQQLYVRAMQVGVTIPKTLFPTSRTELISIADSMNYPAIIKPLTSHHWKTKKVVEAIGSKKALKVTSPKDLIEAYDRVGHLEPRIMVQEIVLGSDKRLLTFLGYMNRDGEVSAGCVRMKLRQSPPGFGYCCLTETIHDGEVMKLSIRLLKALEYRGIGCVEFKRDRRDEVLKLIEINARAVRTTGAAIGAGVDLPYIAYRDSIAQPLGKCFKYRAQVRWIHLRDEMLSARELIHQGELTFWGWTRVFRGSLVFCEWARDDPLPFLIAWRQFTARCIRRICARVSCRISGMINVVQKALCAFHVGELRPFAMLQHDALLGVSDKKTSLWQKPGT